MTGAIKQRGLRGGGGDARREREKKRGDLMEDVRVKKRRREGRGGG